MIDRMALRRKCPIMGSLSGKRQNDRSRTVVFFFFFFFFFFWFFGPPFFVKNGVCVDMVHSLAWAEDSAF
jgi:hypothetical protein